MSMLNILKTFANFGDCPEGSDNILLGIPNWYKGLQCEYTSLASRDARNPDEVVGVNFSSFNDVWTIVANIAVMATRLAAVIAVGFIIYGGIRYIMSQGNPDSLESAKKTITNSVIGLVITLMAGAVVGFVSGVFR